VGRHWFNRNRCCPERDREMIVVRFSRAHQAFSWRTRTSPGGLVKRGADLLAEGALGSDGSLPAVPGQTCRTLARTRAFQSALLDFSDPLRRRLDLGREAAPPRRGRRPSARVLSAICPVCHFVTGAAAPAENSGAHAKARARPVVPERPRNSRLLHPLPSRNAHREARRAMRRSSLA
jgi:hypothetical protein